MPDVQVRIAVAVDELGNWHAAGDSQWDDLEAMGESYGYVQEHQKRYWLTATLPVPEAVEVQAKVEEGNA